MRAFRLQPGGQFPGLHLREIRGQRNGQRGQDSNRKELHATSVQRQQGSVPLVTPVNNRPISTEWRGMV
jgi:hypothetical protein